VLGQKDGSNDLTQTLKLNDAQQILIIPEKLIAGDTRNSIASDTADAIIAGGTLNVIDGSANNAAI